MPNVITAPTAAAQLGAPVWLVRRLADRLARPVRVGPGTRLLTPDDVELIPAELARRGAAPAEADCAS